jgi:hypothetical protein
VAREHGPIGVVAAIVATAVVGLGLALFVAMTVAPVIDMIQGVPVPVADASATVPPPVWPGMPPAPDPLAPRPFDAAVVAFAGKDIGGEKLQDVVPGGPKVTITQRAGTTAVDHARIDLDRDNRWDERWTFGADIVREVSPNDDEAYTQRYRWTGISWSNATGGLDDAARAEVDGVLFKYAHKSLGTDKIKDAVPGRPWELNLYQDPGSPVLSRAKVDYDRNDSWDERITFDGDVVTREVAPADDEHYTEMYRWNGSSWVPS